jgi:hypothetical protein
MATTNYLRNIPYRGYSLQLVHYPPQWHVMIASIAVEAPELRLEDQTVRGWDQSEVVTRAKARIDNFIETD